jgi:microcin C transport system substrate-binding protein
VRGVQTSLGEFTGFLAGKRSLLTGLLSHRSIAYSIAQMRCADYSGLLGRILSHCNCPLTNKAPMTTGSRWVQTPRALRCSVIHRLSRVGLPVVPRSWRSACAVVLCGVSALAGLLVAPEAQAVYAIAQYGEPKYPADFKHFDYVNPDAPKGGTLVLANPSRLTSFDKFNPFTLRGNPAPGIDLMFESLTIGSSDEVASAYGLLADDINIAPDGLSTTFHINPRARFSNGDPVTADDVKFSLDTLKSPQAAPQFASIFGEITRAD